MPQKQGGFGPTRGIVLTFRRKLMAVAQEIWRVLQSPSSPDTLARQLRGYAKVLTPWAKETSNAMVAQVEAASWREWRKVAESMGMTLKREGMVDQMAARMQQLSKEGAKLISSLPLEAAERVEKLAAESLITGERAETLRREIMTRTPEITKARADLIARTETGRAATILTQTRAESLGSEGYIWRTSQDARTRDSHLKMEGKFVRWDSPPTLDGLKGHAGALPNCRCYPEPVIPDLTSERR